MKYKTILEYLTDEIKSDLNDIESVANNPKVSALRSRSIKEMVFSIRKKLDMIGE